MKINGVTVNIGKRGIVAYIDYCLPNEEVSFRLMSESFKRSELDHLGRMLRNRAAEYSENREERAALSMAADWLQSNPAKAH